MKKKKLDFCVLAEIKFSKKVTLVKLLHWKVGQRGT